MRAREAVWAGSTVLSRASATARSMASAASVVQSLISSSSSIGPRQETPSGRSAAAYMASGSGPGVHHVICEQLAALTGVVHHDGAEAIFLGEHERLRRRAGIRDRATRDERHAGAHGGGARSTQGADVNCAGPGPVAVLGGDWDSSRSARRSTRRRRGTGARAAGAAPPRSRAARSRSWRPRSRTPARLRPWVRRNLSRRYRTVARASCLPVIGSRRPIPMCCASTLCCLRCRRHGSKRAMRRVRSPKR